MKGLKALGAAVVAYLRDNPGVVSFIVGEAVILLAKVGVQVTAAQLAGIVAVLMPLLLGYFHVARKASARAKVKKILAAGPIVVPPAPVVTPTEGMTHD